MLKKLKNKSYGTIPKKVCIILLFYNFTILSIFKLNIIPNFLNKKRKNSSKLLNNFDFINKIILTLVSMAGYH